MARNLLTLVRDIAVGLLVVIALVILFWVVFMPTWIISALTGWGRTTKRTRAEVADYVQQFVDGTDHPYDWDDFLSIPISDPSLERIRQRCESAPALWPPQSPTEFCGPEGLAVLRELAQDLRSGSSARQRLGEDA